MTLRRLSAGIPLAAVTAVLVHVAATGFDHVPGLAQAPRLGAVLGASLALAALTVFLRAILMPRQHSIATKAPNAESPLLLGTAGFGFYLALELFEGHGVAVTLPALCAALPLATVVIRGARAIATFLQAAGRALARFASAVTASGGPGTCPAREPNVPLRPAAARRSHRGRAPPLFA